MNDNFVPSAYDESKLDSKSSIPNFDNSWVDVSSKSTSKNIFTDQSHSTNQEAKNLHPIGNGNRRVAKNNNPFFNLDDEDTFSPHGSKDNQKEDKSGFDSLL